MKTQKNTKAAGQGSSHALQRCEERMKTLLELSTEWYWEQDENYRFTLIVGAGSVQTGIDPQQYQKQYLGTQRWDHDAVPVGDGGSWDRHKATLEARQPFANLVFRRVDAQGEMRYVSTSGQPVLDGTRFTGYRGIAKDVTASMRAEQLLRLEHMVARCVAGADSASAALKEVLRSICETQGWECGRYFGRDDKGAVLVMNELWHVPNPSLDTFIEQSREISYAPGAGLIGQVWQSGQPLWVTDIGKDSRVHKGIARQAGMHGTFIFPVVSEGKPIGVLSFHSKKVREPEERLLQAVGVIGSQVGQFLQRKQAEEVTRASNERFRATFDNAPVGIMHTSIDGDRILDTNPKLIEMLGYTRDELLNMSTDDFVHPEAVGEDRPKYREQILTGEMNAFSSERRYVRKDGSTLWVSRTVSLARDPAGRPLYFIRIAEDINERKLLAGRRAMEHDVTQVLAESATVEEAMQLVLRTICQALGWTCGARWKWNETEELLRCTETWHADAEGVAEFVAATRENPNEAPAWHGAAPGTSTGGVVRRVWFSGASVWFPDITQQPDFRRGPMAAKAGLRSAFGFPILAGTRPLGVMEFYSREIEQPDEALLRMVRAIGSQIGQFVQRQEAEERTRNQALRQRLIAEFGQQALASTELADVLNRAAELVPATLKIEYSNVLELAPDRRSLTYKAAVGWPQEWIGHRVVPVDPGSRLEHILSQHEALIIEDYDAESRYATSPLQALGIRSGVQVPILGTQGAFGVLSAHTRQRRRFSEDDLSFLRSVANILATAIERKYADDRLAHLAQFDTVTGLPNRILFSDRLGLMLTQAQRNDWLLGILFVDLDRFKTVNDTYGHAAGDMLLRQVAARLKECLRGSDVVGRLSGDEFALVLSSLAKADDAGLVAQKIVSALAAPFDLDGQQTYISASIGIALFPSDGREPDTLVRNADTAMYRAKEQGRNGYQFYLPQMNERLKQRLERESQLRVALERDEYRLHYQPKVNLETGAISGFEALLRWEHGGRLVSPAEFIPILEYTGLIVPVGEWVVRSACGQIRRWEEQKLAVRPVAVNLSARQFQSKNLAEVIGAILRETGVAPGLLELELTETLLMSDAEEAVETLRELKALGVRLAVDDFGTGYSSLAYLKRFPIDTLKIDRAFVRDTISDPDDAAIALTIINLAHSLKLKVVAEGVETEAQLNFLCLRGCDEMQGFYFARPLPVEECSKWLAEGRRLQLPRSAAKADLPVLLLLDDNEEELRRLEQALDAEYFRIVTATSPKAAFDILALQGARIVISDHHMPEMTGVEFLTRVRKLYPNTVRVVASRSDEAPTLTRATNKAGIHKFLSKSWDPQRLRAEVREAYQQYQQRAKSARA